MGAKLGFDLGFVAMGLNKKTTRRDGWFFG